MISSISSREFPLIITGDNNTRKVSPVSSRSSEGEYLPPNNIIKQEKHQEEINCTVVVCIADDSHQIEKNNRLPESSLSDVLAMYGALNNFTAKEDLKGKLISIII